MGYYAPIIFWHIVVTLYSLHLHLFFPYHRMKNSFYYIQLQCADGFEGKNCQVDINECEIQPCANNASCMDMINGFKCICEPGWTGTTCKVDIDECAGQPCGNFGQCVDLVNGYECECDEGRDGVNCEIDHDYCVDNKCQNDATCVDGLTDYTCACKKGYKGHLCETNINDCAGNPCQHGKCIDLIADYRCVCAAGQRTVSKCDIFTGFESVKHIYNNQKLEHGQNFEIGLYPMI